MAIADSLGAVIQKAVASGNKAAMPLGATAYVDGSYCKVKGEKVYLWSDEWVLSRKTVGDVERKIVLHGRWDY